NKITDNRSTTAREYSLSNFKSNTLGAKYLIYDPYRKRDLEGPNLYSWKANNKTQWADLIPAISIYAGANFDFADNPFTPEAEGKISPKFVLSTQNNWIGGWVFVTNLIVDRVTTDYPTYGYIVTLTHATNRYFSIFLENQGFKSDFYSDQLVRGGAAVLVNKDFHVDLSRPCSRQDAPSMLYGRVGAPDRVDMHKQDEYLQDEATAKVKSRNDQKKEKKGKRLGGFTPDNNG